MKRLISATSPRAGTPSAPCFFSIDGMVYSISIDANEDFGLGYIEGTVRDDGGTPIPGVSVELYGEPFDWDVSRPLIYTDAAGHYRIGYAPGPYTVRFNLATAERDDLEWTPDANFLGEIYHNGEVLRSRAGGDALGHRRPADAGRHHHRDSHRRVRKSFTQRLGLRPCRETRSAWPHTLTERRRALRPEPPQNRQLRRAGPPPSPLSASEWYDDAAILRRGHADRGRRRGDDGRDRRCLTDMPGSISG